MSNVTRPDSSLRYRRYINHLLTYLLITLMKLVGGILIKNFSF